MNASIPRFLDSDRIGLLAERVLIAKADRWAVIRLAALLIPLDVDLADESAVALALLRERLSAATVADVLTEAIELARELRGGRRATR